MKFRNWIFFSIVLVSANAALAADKASLIVAVGGSPCSAGPTNCVSLAKSGNILIQTASGAITKTKISKSGITKISLDAGAYTFSYEIRSPGSTSQKVQQDIQAGIDNVVAIGYDTGIR